MNNKKRTLLAASVLLTVLLVSCEAQEKGAEGKPVERPAQIDTLDNLQVYTLEEQDYDTVEMVRDQVFKSTNEVLFNGYVSDTEVDEQGRVYIKVGKPGTIAIHVFGPDGRHLKRIGRMGRGPGEFIGLGSMEIRRNRLFIFDHRLQRISIFDLSDLSLTDTRILRRDSSFEAESFARFHGGGDVNALEDGSFVSRFEHLSPEDNDEYYFELTEEGWVLPGPLLRLRGPELYEPPPPEPGYFAAHTPVPFSRGPLFAQLDDGTMYAAWSEHFLIKVYDRNGTYQRAIFYPYRKSPLHVSQLETDDYLERRLEENEEKIPATWPALSDIVTDDKNRLWVATITESDSTFQWWVLNRQGKLLARFQWPGKRMEKTVQHAFRITIKDGYWYEREVDYEGLNQIVRYRIDFKSRTQSLANN